MISRHPLKTMDNHSNPNPSQAFVDLSSHPTARIHQQSYVIDSIGLQDGVDTSIRNRPKKPNAATSWTPEDDK